MSDLHNIILEASVEEIRSIFIASLGASLIPIFAIFILFSTQTSRKQLLFWVQSLALFCLLCAAIFELTGAFIDTRQKFDTGKIVIQITMCSSILKWTIPLISDCALTLRLLAVYPLSLTSRSTQIKVMAFPVLIKFPRLVIIICNNVKLWKFANSLDLKTENKILIYQITELSLQILDGLYISILLLLKAHRFARILRRMAASNYFLGRKSKSPCLQL